MDAVSDRIGDACPECGAEIEGAHLRGRQAVLVPCGHRVGSLSAFDVPPDALE
ncbi:MAG: hypothetical protein ABEI39_01200 [Halobacteriales archaeon]